MQPQLNLIDVKPCLCRQISKALCVLNPDRVQSPEEDPQEMEEALETITDFADSIDTSNGTITFYIHLSHRLRNVIITDSYLLQTFTRLVVLSSYSRV